MVESDKKVCTKCKIEKELKEFSLFKRSKDGRAYSCKECNKPFSQKGDAKYRQKKGYSDILKKSYNKHKKKRIDANKERAKQRRKTDLIFKLKENYRNRIHSALSGKVKKSLRTEQLLGCTIQELKDFLESKFKPGMTWNNRGRTGWEIDHIKPCAAFDLSKEEEQLKCFHYTNLQPLWKAENASKGSLFNNKRYKNVNSIDRALQRA